MAIKDMLGEELYSQVIEKLGDKKIMIDDGNFIPKSRFDEINSQKKELKEQVDTLNKTVNENNSTLETLKKSAEASDDLKKQIQEYQDKVNNTQKEFETQLATKETEWQQRDVNNRKSFAMREKLLLEHADPTYIDLLMKEIDLEKVTESDGKFIGVDDVINEVKTKREKLFGKPVVTGTGLQGGTNVTKSTNMKELENKAKLGDKAARLEIMKASKDAIPE